MSTCISKEIFLVGGGSFLTPKHDGERERESGELPLGWTAQTGALPLSYTRVLFSEGATPVC